MIRLSLLALYVGGFALYAWKDWYKSLCALILLMAVVEHPDMPKSILGFQGLNPWNVLLISVVFAWAKSRREELAEWDMPQRINVLLALYLGVVVVGVCRMVLDRDALDESVASLVSEKFINTIKWVVPGLLLFDGARNKERFRLGLMCVGGVYLLLGLQVIKWMPLSYAISGESLSARSLKILTNEIGYHRVNLSAMLAGASWAIFCTRVLATTTRQRAVIVIATLLVMYAQALTAGRAGYVTWAVVGFALLALRWPRYLMVAPLVPIALVVFAPGAAQRMLEGFSAGTRDVNPIVAAQSGSLEGEADDGPDVYTITAGRIIIWPYVVAKIAQSPLIGYGREAMIRTGITRFLAVTLGEGFAHPHNAYLELLLDNGLMGFVPVMLFFAIILGHAVTLLRDSRHPVFIAAGGVAFTLVGALLAAGMGSQTFYPREGWLGMWCAIGLMLRVAVAREQWLASGAAAGSVVGAPVTALHKPYNRPAPSGRRGPVMRFPRRRTPSPTWAALLAPPPVTTPVGRGVRFPRPVARRFAART